MVEEERKETLNEVNDKKELPTHRRTPEALHDFGPKAVYSGIKRVPCMRSSLMYGIVGGLGVGMLRYYWRANVMVSCNYAVGMFAISSVLTWHLCTYQHDDNIKRARVFVEAVRSNRGAAIGDSNHTTSATQDR